MLVQMNNTMEKSYTNQKRVLAGAEFYTSLKSVLLKTMLSLKYNS